MQTQFANSSDGTRIAFDVTGNGPPLVLLHGLPVNRESWHGLGYVEHFAPHYTVVTLDARGSGESDHPTTPRAYAIDKILADVLAVVDAAGVQRFVALGFSYGAAIALCLAARSDRLSRAVVLGQSLRRLFPEAFVTRSHRRVGWCR